MTNSDLINNMKNLGINISSVLIPNDKINMQKWSVVACINIHLSWNIGMMLMNS